tara:strand:- start:12376 stop:12969 length:594 start_codon:yes stop_codon:yes gene_type:complete
MNDQLSSSSLKDLLGGRNLYLIGMMGSGKSLTGPLLAKEMGYGFVDSDQVIEKVAKSSISEIFAKEGEIGFRDIESKVLKEIGQLYSLVVATGGGVVMRPENWGVLHQGVVIWIDPGRNELLARLKLDNSPRPMLNENDPISAFDQIYQDRQLLYKEADLKILVVDESPKNVALKILNNLPSILIDSGNLSSQQTTE